MRELTREEEKGEMFKVGDKVELVDNKGMSNKPGATATVREVKVRNLVIVWDVQTPQVDGEYFAMRFKLCTPKIDYLKITKEIIGDMR